MAPPHIDPEATWRRHLDGTDHLKRRPHPGFDPDFYLATYGEVAAAGIDPAEHYRLYGQAEGRYPTRFRLLLDRHPGVLETLGELLTDTELARAVAGGSIEAAELTFELMALGEPVDRRIGRFSAAHYLYLYPEVGAAGLTPLMHYVLHGRDEGRQTLKPLAEQGIDPNTTSHHPLPETGHDENRQPPAELPGQPFDPQAIWRRHLNGTRHLDRRPSYDFDPDFYLATYTEVAAAGIDPTEHYRRYGQAEGRYPTRFRLVLERHPDVLETLGELLTDPDLAPAVVGGDTEAAELAFELMALGNPIDRRIGRFSAAYYLALHPEVRKAATGPLVHYVLNGRAEGRQSLEHLLDRRLAGQRAADPDKPVCLICLPEMSATDIPRIALDLAREAVQSHNVVVYALQGGPLLDRFRSKTVTILLGDRPARDFDHWGEPLLDRIDVAILTSVESFLFLKPLVTRGIPFACYVHEYADYAQPAYKGIATTLFADLLVYPSGPVRASYDAIFADLGIDPDRDTMIQPQAALAPGTVAPEAYRAARARLSGLIGQEIGTRRLVLGAGPAQWRTGTDLFVLTAQIARARDPDTLFLWVGDGRNHEDPQFGIWLERHLREARANTADGTLHILPAGPQSDDAFRAADVLYLPSRLDPLPNAVFDAVRSGARVLTFKGATGFDDPRYAGADRLHAVAYGDLDAAATTALMLPRKIPAAEAPAAAPEPLFEPIRLALAARRDAAPAGSETGPGDYDVPVMFTSRPEDAAGRATERRKLWRLGRRYVWPSRKAAETALAGSDNWVHGKLRIAGYAPLAPQTLLPAFAVHMHAYHTENLARDLAHYGLLAQAARIVITTDTPEKATRAKSALAGAGLAGEVLQMPNTGRDILPFLRLFGPGGVAGDDTLWCHLHQKKAPSLAVSGDVWHRFLMTILLGEGAALSNAVAEIAKPGIGLVTAFDPYWLGWLASRRLLPLVADKMPGPLPRHPGLFPCGNMFWVRAEVARAMFDLFGPDYPWPNEPIPQDGTVYHLIERLWPSVAAAAGYGSVFLDKPDQKRN